MDEVAIEAVSVVGLAGEVAAVMEVAVGAANAVGVTGDGDVMYPKLSRVFLVNILPHVDSEQNSFICS